MFKHLFHTALFMAALAALLAYRSQIATFGEQLPLWRVSNQSGVVTPESNHYAPPSRCYAQGVVEGLGDVTELKFELSGKLTVVNCSDEHTRPQTVRRGDILARIDHSLWLEKVHQAEAALAKATAMRTRLVEGASRSQREEARATARAQAALVRSTYDNYRRTETLAADNIIPQQDLDEAAADYRSAYAKWKACKAKVAQLEDAPRAFEIQEADAEIRLAKSQLQQAKNTLHKTVLRAPCDGTVLSVNGEVGELTGPDSQSPIVTLVDARHLRVRAYVDEVDALKIEHGQRVQATTDSLPNEPIMGRVESCLASLQPKTELRHSPTEKHDTKVREVVIVLDSDQPALGKLVIGLPVDVAIDTSPATPGDLPTTGSLVQAERQGDVHDATESRAPWYASNP